MRTQTPSIARILPDGTPLHNRLLAALPAGDYRRIRKHLRMSTVTLGVTLQEHGAPVANVYFPNGGVFSITNQMGDGALVEVATVGTEGMLGIGVFLGDRSGAGRMFQQVGDGPVPTMAAARFAKETVAAGAFREIVGRYVHANLLQTMQSSRVQCAARCETAVLPLVAPDPQSSRGQRVPAQTRVPRGHARGAPSHRDRGAAIAPAGRIDFQRVQADPHTETKTAGAGVVRVLRRGPRPLRHGSDCNSRAIVLRATCERASRPTG